jgi:large subunit ribosomal protein L35
MPKLKTVKGVADRIRVTGTGKLMAFRAGRRHLLTGKRSKRMRQRRRPHRLSRADTRALRRLLSSAAGA